MPKYQLGAAARLGVSLEAALADTPVAIAFLTKLGFTGLKQISSENNRISFKFAAWQEDTLSKAMKSEPDSSRAGDLTWKYGKSGLIIVKQVPRLVVLKNNVTGVVKDIPTLPPLKPLHIKETDQPAVVPEIPAKEANKVPAIHVTDELIHLFLAARGSQSRTLMDSFFKRAYAYLNKTKFHNALKTPHLVLLKDSGTRFRLRGAWRVWRNEMVISPRCFAGNVGYFFDTLLHEMCHQAVSHIDRIESNVDGGHGPEWQAWMRKVGLPPDRYDKIGNTEYMTEKELRDRQAYIDKHKQRSLDNAVKLETLEQRLNNGLQPTKPEAGKLVSVLQRGRFPMHGVLLGPRQHTPSIWNFIPDDYLKRATGARQKQTMTLGIDVRDIFDYEGTAKHIHDTSANWKRLIETMLEFQKENKLA